MNSGPTVHRGSGTSAGSPPGSLNESQSRSMVHFCVSRRVRERGWRGQKKEKRRKRVFRTHKAIHIGPSELDVVFDGRLGSHCSSHKSVVQYGNMGGPGTCLWTTDNHTTTCSTL